MKPLRNRIHFSFMLACALGLRAGAATVSGNLTDISRRAFDTPLVITPVPEVLIGAAGLSAGPARVIETTNGAFEVELEAGDYLVSLPLVPGRKPFAIAVPHTGGLLHLTNLMNPPRTYTYTNAPPGLFPAELVLYPATLACAGGNQRDQSGAATPVCPADSIAIFPDGPGGRTSAAVPNWVTQAVSTITLLWTGGAPLTWTNRYESFWHPDPGVREICETTDSPVTLTNYLNLVSVTNHWPPGNAPKGVSLVQPCAPTNNARAVGLLKWRLHLYGEPAPDNF